MHPLHQHISSHISISEQEFEKFFNLLEFIKCTKKELIIQPGKAVKHQYFVLKGCLRTFLIDSFGKEHTIQFAVENWWASDYIAYYKEQNSVLSVECIEDCELLKIHKDDLHTIFDELPALERFFRRQLENAFVASQIRILSNLHRTAEERYELFLKSYPTIEQRVKNYQIASYLGITPESLSRLRIKRRTY